MPIRVAVDAMGGDAAPAVVIEGAIRAAQQSDADLQILLTGPEAQLREMLAAQPEAAGLPITVHDAPQIIGMGEAPTQAVRSKPQSSIHVGLGLHKAGEADAFVSAGNTGAVMAASLFILGRLPGVLRPSVIGFFPTTTSYCIVLDVGTNVDCKPEHLVQFAQMGSIYAARVMKRETPTVGLLNIGEEPGKGNDIVKEAYALLEAHDGVHFGGNVEGRDVFRHAADVIVCDGFVGNVMLKLGESLVTVLGQLVRKEMAAQELTGDQQQVVGGVLRGVLRPFDYEEYGGAPLLGVDGTVLIGHGSASARAIARLIRMGAEVAQQEVPASIAQALQG